MNPLADIQKKKKKKKYLLGKGTKILMTHYLKLSFKITGPGKVMEIDVVNQNFSGNAQVIYLPRKYFL